MNTKIRKLIGKKAAFLYASAVINLATVGTQQCIAAPGDLYVADPLAREVDRFTPNGEKAAFASGLNQPLALAFDRQGNLFVGDSGNCVCMDPPCDCPPSLIYKYTPEGTRSTFIDLGPLSLWAMAFDGSGNLFVSTGAQILKVTANGSSSEFAYDPNVAFASLAFDVSGNLYAGVIKTGPGYILRFTPDGKSTTFYTTRSSEGVLGLAFDGNRNLFAQLGNTIIKIAPDGTATTFANVEFAFPDSLALDGSGNLFAGILSFDSSDPAILKFSADGTQTTFAFGPLSPAGLAFEPITEKLRNISARGLVGTGDDVLIGGFIVGGNALANNAVVVRAIGPSLTQAGVSNALADPTLELHDSSGALVASNDDWQDTQEEQITASGLAPTDPKEAAIYATLPAGNYTAVVRGAADTTGTALVEIYSSGM